MVLLNPWALCHNSFQQMTPALRFRIIYERNGTMSMEMSFFAWNMEISFFGMPLAQTWLARTQYHAKDAILIANEKRYSQRRARAGLIYS